MDAMLSNKVDKLKSDSTETLLSLIMAVSVIYLLFKVGNHIFAVIATILFVGLLCYEGYKEFEKN